MGVLLQAYTIFEAVIATKQDVTVVRGNLKTGLSESINNDIFLYKLNV